jgi:hypothetical protein
MLIEQSLINPNFIGKDAFRWFVGIVTKYKNTENGYRVKVRIIGHHPDAAEIVKDEELPWAHVLVPLNFGAGEGGSGISFNPRGSETVIGFFMDGDDGQQPVIIGALFSNSKIVHTNSFNQGTNGFNPYRTEKSPINQSNLPESGQPAESGIPNAGGAAPKKGGGFTKSKKQAADDQRQTVVQTVSPCKSGTDTFSKITKALRKFIYYLNTVTNYINVYVNPTLNYIQNIPELIRDVAVSITDGLSEWIKVTRDNIIQKIHEGLKGLIEGILPKDLILAKKIATDKIVDGIWCLFQNILKKLFTFVFDFLAAIIGKVVSVPLCAAEAFVGSMMQTISNEIQETIGPAIEEISSTLGTVIGEVSLYVSSAISYAKLALSFLSCENAKCKEEFDYEMNKGYVPKGSPDFEKIIKYSPGQGVRNLFSDGTKQIEGWFGSVGGTPDPVLIEGLGYTLEDFIGKNFECDGVTLNCGVPKVTIFGGDGNNANGSAIIDVLGQVMGVNIINPGLSYSTEPYLIFEDDCNIGTGAKGYAVTKDGKVDSVVMTSNGANYIGPEGDPCTTNPIGEDGKEYTAYISEVIIISTGIGYKETDLIYNVYCDSDVKIYPIVDPEGRIIGTNIVNPGTAIRTVPELAINTEGGSSAILLPVLKFKEVGPMAEADRAKIKKVILCAETHDN